MEKIDAHQHFWKYDPKRDKWITEEMKILQNDFLPGDLRPLLTENDVTGTVVIQSAQSEKETIFQLRNAEENDFIKGVVGWVDLCSGKIEEDLEFYSGFQKIKGFRHILQAETRRDAMLQPSFMRGIKMLKNYDFAYDILVFADQLKYLPEFISAFPSNKFVLDHMGKPAIKDQQIKDWAKEIRDIAVHENVYCKISGMVTEADWYDWDPSNFKNYIDTIVESFGANRIMFGSDWPVCLLSASYNKVMLIVQNYFSYFSESEQQQFFSLNASRFYNL
jgi:L-fuconolactonase